MLFLLGSRGLPFGLLINFTAQGERLGFKNTQILTKQGNETSPSFKKKVT